MNTNPVELRLPMRALLLAVGLLSGTAALTQHPSTPRKPFFCFADMNPMDGRGVETAYSSIRLGSPDDKRKLELSFFKAAQTGGAFNAWPTRTSSGCFFSEDADQAAAARDATIESFRRSYGPSVLNVRHREAGEISWDGGGLSSPLPARANKAARSETVEKVDSAASAETETAEKLHRQKEAEIAEKLRRQKEAAAQAEAVEQARVAELNQQIADANKKLADENARKIADYEAKVAAYQESLARAAAAKKDYEEKLAQNAREVQAHRDAVNTYNNEVAKSQAKGGVEVVSRLTGPYRKTKEEALATLMSVSKSYPDVFDIKCERMAGSYYEEPWSCWGSYREVKTRSAVSKQ